MRLIFIPRYLNDVKCIGSACEDTCWDFSYNGVKENVSNIVRSTSFGYRDARNVYWMSPTVSHDKFKQK